jgi:HEAT repeat protein
MVARGADGEGFPNATEAALQRALSDDSAAVRVAAAEAFATVVRAEPAIKVLEEVLRTGDRWPKLQALNVLDRLGERARPSLPTLRDALADAERAAVSDNAPGGSARQYTRNLLTHLIALLEGIEQPLVYPEFR